MQPGVCEGTQPWDKGKSRHVFFRRCFSLCDAGPVALASECSDNVLTGGMVKRHCAPQHSVGTDMCRSWQR